MLHRSVLQCDNKVIPRVGVIEDLGDSIFQSYTIKQTFFGGYINAYPCSSFEKERVILDKE